MISIAARDIGPDRRDDQHIVARIDQGLDRQHDALHAGGGDDDPVGRDRLRMQPGLVVGQRPGAAAECRARRYRRSRRPRARFAAASVMKRGVGRSPSPNHSGRTSGSPMPSMATSAISEALRLRICERTVTAMKRVPADGI
jgi:hypothetical protein